MTRKHWLTGLLVLLCAWSALAQRMEVITPQGALPEQILPLVEQVLQPGETVKVFRNQLIIVASDASMQRVRELLQEVDRPPRNLLIQVSDSVNTHSDERNVQASGSVGNDRARIHVNERAHAGDDHVDVNINEQHDDVDMAIQQQIRAVEGYPAFIAQSQQAPAAVVDAYGRTIVTSQAATQGFFVTVRLQGGQVFLDISTSHDSFADARLDTRRTSTTVSGRLGEWISLGGVTSQSSSQSAGIGQQGERAASSTGTLSLRVSLED